MTEEKREINEKNYRTELMKRGEIVSRFREILKQSEEMRENFDYFRKIMVWQTSMSEDRIVKFEDLEKIQECYELYFQAETKIEKIMKKRKF